MRTGRGAGVGFFFDFGIYSRQVVFDQSLAFEIGDKRFPQFFSLRGVNNMLVKRPELRVFQWVVQFFFQPAGHRAVKSRTADFAIQTAYNQFVIPDDYGFFPQVSFKKTRALDDAGLVFVLLVNPHFRTRPFQANFWCPDSVFAQAVNPRGTRGHEQFLPAADSFCVFSPESYCHFPFPSSIYLN